MRQLCDAPDTGIRASRDRPPKSTFEPQKLTHSVGGLTLGFWRSFPCLIVPGSRWPSLGMWREEKMRALLASLAGKRVAEDATEEHAKGHSQEAWMPQGPHWSQEWPLSAFAAKCWQGQICPYHFDFKLRDV
eukprot:352536-Chlamydomonas_euryale.AAC.1